MKDRVRCYREREERDIVLNCIKERKEDERCG